MSLSEQTKAALAKKRNERDARRIKRRKDDLLEALNAPHMRRILFWVMGLTGPYRSTFVSGMPDASAFNEGRRSVGLELLNELLDVKPEAYIQMLRENTSERRQDELEDEDLVKKMEESNG